MFHVVFTKKIIALVLFTLLGTQIFAGGRAELPARIRTEPQERVYLSPGNKDGMQDVLEIVFEPRVEIPSRLRITGYEMNVFDATGKMVFQQSEKQQEQRSLSGRVRWSGPAVVIPDKILWDGRQQIPGNDPNNGNLLEDGDYTYQIVLFDSAGNKSESPPFAITIDNVPPDIFPFPRPINSVFSPNGDGLRDFTTVFQNGSREFKWEIQIVNESGDQIVAQVFTSDDPANRVQDILPPEEFVWDGLDDDGQPLPDGVYAYQLTGSDRAGNSRMEELPRKLIINQKADLVNLEVEEGQPAFSPNEDGVRDQISLIPSVLDPDRVTNWSFFLVSKDNPDEALKFSSGVLPAPESFSWDGRDAAGELMPDGVYEAVFSILNGEQLFADTVLDIHIDTLAPQVSVTANTLPNPTPLGRPLVFGGEGKDSMQLDVSGETSVEWNLIVSDEAGNEQMIDLPSLEDGSLRVNWTNEMVNDLPDGTYTLIVQGRDAAGNLGRARPVKTIKDTRVATVGVLIDGQYLAPTSESNNTISILPQYSVKDLIEEFLLEIVNSEGKVVRSLYKQNPFDEFKWEGLANGNAFVADGEYFVNFRIKYLNGNLAEVERQGSIILDRSIPKITKLESEYRLFSPNGDSRRDVVVIRQEVEEIETDLWTVNILSPEQEVIKTADLGSQVSDYTWDGSDDAGNIVPDGDYLYMLVGEDQAGNRTEKLLPIIVDTGQFGASRWSPGISITVGPQPFTPDGDGENDELTIALSSDAQSSGIASWELAVFDPRGEIFATFDGEGSPNEEIFWDGSSESGELLQSAETYTIRLQATDLFGNIGEVEESLETGIFVIREADGRLRIRIPSIYFGGYLSDFLLVNDEQLDSNLETVQTLARILNKYEEYSIQVEGHAAHLLWNDETLRSREQEEILLPLSRGRAENVRRALIILGVDRARMRTVGVGGSVPVVSHDDETNRWKNRRVEFILEKE